MTPVELDRAERAMNRAMATADDARGAPRRRVCLHPDRTRTETDNLVREECDYCPAFGVVYGPGTPPDLMPYLYWES